MDHFPNQSGRIHHLGEPPPQSSHHLLSTLSPSHTHACVHRTCMRIILLLFSRRTCRDGSFPRFCQSDVASGHFPALPGEALWVILSDGKRGGECYLHAALMFKRQPERFLGSGGPRLHGRGANKWIRWYLRWPSLLPGGAAPF